MTEESAEKPVSFHHRLGRIREKLFHNDESGLSLEGLLDAFQRIPLQVSDDNDRKIKAEFTEYQSLMANPTDFDSLATIGHGHFGTVHLVRENTGSNRIYAMKRMAKNGVTPQSAQIERDIMAKTKSNWLVPLKYAFQDPRYLYLVMEYCPGGDLRHLLDRNDGRLSAEMTQFYLAELTLAINAVHSLGYVHRDIKPENVLLDRFGHLKLTDFGSAELIDKKDQKGQDKPIGTPNYVSPEILQCLENDGDGCHETKSDYWSMGVVAHEMITGKTPFAEASSVKTYHNIMHKKTVDQLGVPKVPKELQQLLDGLLTDIEYRFGYAEVVRHEYFLNVDWDELSNACAPFMPNIKDLSDTTYFDLNRSSSEAPEPDPSSLKKKDGKSHAIIGFSYAGKHPESLRYSRQFGGDDCSDIVSSLRRQNEDLRIKLSKLEREKRLSEKRQSTNTDSDSKSDLEKLRNQERQDLKVTISKLEKLLETEREERSQMERKSVEMLTELRKSWQEREEIRVQGIRSSLEKAENRKVKLENELRDAVRIIEGQTSQIESATDVKESLKNKLKEYKARLEESVTKYKQALNKIERLKHDHSGVVQELESKACTSVREKTFLLDEFESKVDDLESEVQSLKEELTSAQKVNKDQKETIKNLKKEKNGSEVERAIEMKELRNAKFDVEQAKADLKSQLKAAKEENQLASRTIREQNEKLDSLEKILAKFEKKLQSAESVPSPKPRKILQDIQAPPTQPKQLPCECKEAKEEVKMKAIEVRMLERKIEKLEERIKFLRETMIKEEKEGRLKAESELKEANEKLEKIDKNQMEVKEVREVHARTEKRLREEVETLEKKLLDQRQKEQEITTLKNELERTKTQMTNLKKSSDEMSEFKDSFLTLKTTCIELQEQIGDYEALVDKLERKVTDLKQTNDRLTKEITEMSETVSSVKIEKNELQSKLIYTETQFKAVQAKHNDIETLYKEEEKSWNERLSHLNLSKQDQSDALVNLKNQLNALAKNYDLVNEEVEGLRNDNLALKEERSQLITNLSSLKDSNLKLNSVMEEMLEKIAKRNKEIQKMKEDLASVLEDKDKHETETHTQIIQLRKLVDHLQAKNDAMKVKGKAKKRHADQSYALSYEEIQEELIQERHKVRTLMEENRRFRSGSPVRK
ncbi:hypothetical protein TCAL_04488 [Tigriopus californicus]|uniref:non-specific serine/threonine protein kinase n=1 Tax=Tigriopus californicus TaxID=6832 RepID=A0A553NY73_TIGCA|nr:citron Rho-interacting kinase-like [Tigriopus californicus]TRY70368.1 hypothetical protein TCAL_04488 [Tigriopus californicus]